MITEVNCLFFDTHLGTQLDLAYEDVGDPDPDPTGIGRSYDVTIQVVSSTPARDTLAQWSSVNVSFSLDGVNSEL